MPSQTLLEIAEQLTPADHQTHRRYVFVVPAACRELTVHTRYAPKLLSAAKSAGAVRDAIQVQAGALGASVGRELSTIWATAVATTWGAAPIANLLTVSLDDAAGVYRGAAHRQAPDQRLRIGPTAASPGLTAGPLPPGTWVLTLSVHTLVTPQCDVSIQIGAEIASNAP